MNVALWAVQGVLALMFLLAAGMKLFAYDRFVASATKRHPDRPLGRPLESVLHRSMTQASGLKTVNASRQQDEGRQPEVLSKAHVRMLSDDPVGI